MNRLPRLLIALLLLLVALPTVAQSDALNLPADLYVLLNEGIVQRYGVGAAGVANVTPSDVFVVDFAVSPDGTQIAYRTQDGLILAPLAEPPAPGANVDPSAGVPPARGRGVTIAWTPQGDAIAYTTLDGARVWYTTGAFGNIVQSGIQHLQWSPNGEYLVAGVPGNIYWVYQRQNPSLALVSAIPSSVGVAWMSDAVLAFVPETGGLFVMDLRAANAQSQLLDTGSTYQLPFATPDNGGLLVFRRSPADANLPAGFGQLVSVVPGTPLAVVGQTPIDLSGGLQWGPGGRLMIAFQGGVLALYDPVTGQGFPLPIASAVTYGWGVYPPPEASGAMPAAVAAEEAIFPDAFPTFDPLTPIPGVSTATPPAVTAEASG